MCAISFTVSAAGGTPGFDLDTAAGCVFGSIAGSLLSIGREVGVQYTVAVYHPTTRQLVGADAHAVVFDGQENLGGILPGADGDLVDASLRSLACTAEAAGQARQIHRNGVDIG